MTDFELQILRECAGELPSSPWGAAVGACLEYLTGHGYLHLGQVTQKGRDYLDNNSINKDNPK